MSAPACIKFNTLLNIFLILGSFAINGIATADIEVLDDSKRLVSLQAPAKRIVSLAPHVTELLFAAGAGDHVVGVADYSDFPPQAKEITKIGGHNNFDLETIISLKPDLVVAWQSGNPPRMIQQLESFGIKVFITEPANMDDIAKNILSLGVLSGKRDAALKASEDFRVRHRRLKEKYQNRKTLRVFYQVWHQPLMTINGKHIISDVIRLCGGENIFSGLSALAPQIDMEAVLAADPQVIVAGGVGVVKPQWMEDWRKWPELKAVKNNALYFIPPDIIQRHTTRILLGAEMLCGYLDEARLE